MPYVLQEKLWYTADKNTAVPDGDPRAAFLIGPAGYTIADEEAERLGLKAQEPKANKAMPAPQNKAVVFPPEVKGSEGDSSNGDELPDDFPAVEILREAGHTTYTAVRSIADLTKLRGIGKATAEKIKDALP